MKKMVFFVLIALLPALLKAQASETDSSYLVNLNQRVDDRVVEQNTAALDSLYAADFIFSHGSGNIQDKKAWLATVGRTKYNLRRHDSVTAEIHPGIAIIKGKMDIERIDKTKTAKYHLKYIRVYALRNKSWQMISHSTTQEIHDP
jgi:hypothetical protein